MKLRDRIAVAGRLQQERGFKVIASSAVGLLIIGGFVTYLVLALSGRIGSTRAISERFAGEFLETPAGQTIAGVLQGDDGLIAVGVGSALLLALWLAIIWLGAALSYLAFTIAGAGLAGLIYAIDPSSVFPRLIIGLVLLAQGFVVGIQGLRAALSPHAPVFAVARNVLNEAVRMKISMVFIVLLVIGLALLPSLLDPEEALRYRVQTFLSWGTNLSFAILAVLTLLLGVATVTFEQRDKIIWQTVTKPVAAWQYVLGKWLGLAGLNAVLLAVCSGGVFLFTEYLRTTPALGEREAFVATGNTIISDDRLQLETQVLAARDSIAIEYPQGLYLGSPMFLEALEARIIDERRTQPNAGTTTADQNRIAGELLEQLREEYRSLPPTRGVNDSRIYVISGLERARELGKPIILRYRIDAAGNRPDQIYTVSFVFPQIASATPLVRQSGLGFFHNETLSPDFIDDQGRLVVQVFNGEIFRTADGGVAITPNQSSMSFPEGGLHVTYEVGSYHLNYLRAVVVLWVKLAMLAMLAVCTGTFLSFSVASLVSFGVFLLAEMSGWLANAGDIYGYKDNSGNYLWYKVITTPVAEAVGFVFQQYDGLNPVDKVVQGLYLSWSDLAGGSLVIMMITCVFFGLGVLIFSRRELAIYSGQ
ncbi:MAG: hypothetical protein AAF235_01205 [Planctomycetota bacterium]